MYAYWGAPQLRDPGSNGFAFQSSAVNGELLELNVGNASTCKGLPLIRDLNKLLVIRDEEFLKYSAGERRNLLTRFSTAICSVSTDESLILFFTTNSPTQTNLPERK
jgi:hypothetical protein